MRSEAEIKEQLNDLNTDLSRYLKMCNDGDISFEEYDDVRSRYRGYIECFEFVLGYSDVYGRTPDFDQN